MRNISRTYASLARLHQKKTQKPLSPLLEVHELHVALHVAPPGDHRDHLNTESLRSNQPHHKTTKCHIAQSRVGIRAHCAVVHNISQPDLMPCQNSTT